jgi:DNA-binding NtrC family response regulator
MGLATRSGGCVQGPSGATPEPVGFGRRVLVADDSAWLRRAIGRALRADGHEVVEVTDGLELIERLAESAATAVVVIVAAVRLSGLTGMDVLAVLRCMAWPTPVILLAETEDADTDGEARELGAAVVLHLPVDMNRLRELVSRAMAFGVEQARARRGGW